jgi:hypothetical protein
MVYLISCTYDMTPLSQLYAVCCMLYVTCITIIDTIILTNYTNDAYTYDTYDASQLLGELDAINDAEDR